MLYSNDEVAQQSASFSLQPIVEIPVLTSAGVLVTGKRSPVTASFVSYDVYIHTGGRSLDTWILQFAFDTSFLQYDSQSTGDLWLEASPLYDDMEIINSNGILELQSRASGTDPSVLTGSNLYLLSVSFAVVGNGFANDCINVTALSLADLRSAVYPEGGITGQVVDLFGTSTSGSLLIPVSQTMGMFVASQKTEVVNTAVLNEIAVSTIYQAFHLMDNGDRVSASLALCEAPGATTILSGDSCFISIDATTPPERVEVWLESETFARSVPITVWNPENAKMILDRDTIYPIESACNMWTPAHVSVYVDLRHGETLVRRVLVTDHISFSSSDTSVVTISGRTVRAVASGEAMILGANLAAPIQVSSDSSISISTLQGALFTNVEFTPQSRSINYNSRDRDDTIEVTVNLLQQLNDEFDEGSIFVYAQLDDNSFVSITSSNFLTVQSNAPKSLVVSSPFLAMVPFGAASASGDLITIALTDCNGNEFIQGSIDVDVSIPTATNVIATMDCERIADLSDAAADYAQFNIPPECSIIVTMYFDDGTEKNVQDDSRIRYESLDSNLVIDDVGTVSVASNTAGTSSVNITFVDWPSSNGLFVTASVLIVKLDYIQGVVLPYPSNTGSYSDPSILEQIHCTNTFERAFFETTAFLTDGTSADVSMDATHTSTIEFIASVEIDTVYGGMVIIPNVAGMTEVSSTFYGQSTAQAMINVLMSPITITEMTLYETEFNGKKGTSQKMRVDIVLSDGTKLDNVQDEPWINLEEIVDFSSNAGEAVTIGADGSMTINGNYHDAVEISGGSACSADKITDVTLTMGYTAFPSIEDEEAFHEVLREAIADLIKESVDNICINCPAGRRNLQANDIVVIRIRTSRPDYILGSQGLGSDNAENYISQYLQAQGYVVFVLPNSIDTANAVQTSADLDPIGSSVFVYPNVLPDPWDFDLDAQNTLGLQFPPSNEGDILTLDIKLNAEEGRLDAWDIFVKYDPAYVSISSCWVGYDWGDKTFEANVDSVPGVAHLGGLGGNDLTKRNVEGFTLTLAHCTMNVISAEPVLVEIQTEITELGVFINNEAQALGSSISSAGSGVLKINGGSGTVSPASDRRKLDATCGHHLFAGSPECTCDENITGDVSGDCSFNVYDAQAAAYYLSSVEIPDLLSLDELTEFQRQQLDLNLDYLKDPQPPCFIATQTPPCVNNVGDIGFLVKFAFDKRRTLDQNAFPIIALSADEEQITLRVKLDRFVSSIISPATSSDTRVMFEINTLRNRHITFEGVTNDPWVTSIEKYVVPASHDGEYFTATTHGPFQSDTIGVAILVEALDSAGAASEDRQYAYGSSQYYGAAAFEAYAEIQVEGTLSPTGTPVAAPTVGPTLSPTCPVCPPPVICNPSHAPVIAPTTDTPTLEPTSPTLSPSTTPNFSPTNRAKGTTSTLTPTRFPTVNNTGDAMNVNFNNSDDMGFVVGMMTGLAVMFALCCLAYVLCGMRYNKDSEQTLEVDFDALNRYQKQQKEEEERKRLEEEADREKKRRAKEIEDLKIAPANPHEEALRRIGEQTMFMMSPSASAEYELGEDGVYRVRARTMDGGHTTGGYLDPTASFTSFTEDGYGGLTGDYDTRPTFSESVLSADGDYETGADGDYETGADGDLVTGYDDDSDMDWEKVEKDEGGDTRPQYTKLKSDISESFDATPRGAPQKKRSIRGERSMGKRSARDGGATGDSRLPSIADSSRMFSDSSVLISPPDIFNTPAEDLQNLRGKRRPMQFAPQRETNTFLAPNSQSVLPNYDPPEFSADSTSAEELDFGGSGIGADMSRIWAEEPSNTQLWIASSGNLSLTAAQSRTAVQPVDIDSSASAFDSSGTAFEMNSTATAFESNGTNLAAVDIDELSEDQQNALYAQLRRGSSKAFLKNAKRTAGTSSAMFREESNRKKRGPQFGGSKQQMWIEDHSQNDLVGRRLGGDASFTADTSMTAFDEGPSDSLTAYEEDDLDMHQTVVKSNSFSAEMSDNGAE